MKNRKATILIMIPLVAMLLTTGCNKKEKEAPPRPPTPVSVATAQQVDVPVYMPSFGRLQALSDIDVQAQVSGKILDAPFVEGTQVKKGDVLFHIEPDTYQATVRQAKAQLDGAKADLKQKKDTLKRNKELVDQKLISENDYEQLKTSVDAAKATVKQATAALEQANINLGYCEVTSPVTGIAGKRLVDPGNIVAAGAGQVLVNVRTIDPIYADFTLSETYLAQAKAAMEQGDVRVLVVLEENNGHAGIFHGQLKMLDNTINTQSGTIGLRALVENQNGTLWPGQFAFIHPMLDRIKDAIVVPQSAVSLGKDGSYSYVVKNGKVELRIVTKDVNVGNAVVISEGIENGDVVVTAGQLALWPGAPVSIKKELSTEQEAAVQKNLSDPNILSTIRTMAAVGVKESEITIFTGVPTNEIRKVVGTNAVFAGKVSGDKMIQRMGQNGMSNEDIANVTGMSIDDVQKTLDNKEEKTAEK